MRNLSLPKTITTVSFVLVLLLCGQKNASAAFDANWGISFDNGLPGYRNLAQWLVSSGYYSNMTAATNFAKTGYIGHGASDPDPFSFSSGHYQAQIVAENAAHADTNSFGYYTGSGASKSLTQIFNGTQNGPSAFTVGQSFGFYLAGIEGELWYTNRAENESRQKGFFLKDAHGNAQGLIYTLKPGEEWLVAWEDQDASRLLTDRDYNDMYVKLTAQHGNPQVVVTPEPVSSILFLLGGGVMAGIRMRKKYS